MSRIHVTSPIMNINIITCISSCSITYKNGQKNNFPVRGLLSMQDPKMSSEQLVLLIKDCDERRKAIEKEMEDMGSSLSSTAYLGVGLHKPLIDNDGFPLPGVDLHEVRGKRNRFAVLTNDLRVQEDQLAELLHTLHENARLAGSIQRGDRKSLLPFGKVTEVLAASPAEEAGLLVGDRIVRLGHLQTTTIEGSALCYDSIPTVVQNREKDQPLEIQVQRIGREEEEIILRVDLTSGRLGCLIKKV